MINENIKILDYLEENIIERYMNKILGILVMALLIGIADAGTDILYYHS